MRNSHHRFTNLTVDVAPVECVQSWSAEYLLAGEYEHAPTTLSQRRLVLNRFVGHLHGSTPPEANPGAIRAYLARVAKGEFGKTGRPSKPRTVRDYHGILRAFFNWCCQQNYLQINPMQHVTPPKAHKPAIQSLSANDVAALLKAAKRTQFGRRDYAIVLLMLDAGLRASEVCGLRLRDLDLDHREVHVWGKGRKARIVPFSTLTARALFDYLSWEEGIREEDDALFLSQRDDHLTRNGLLQLFRRLAKDAGLSGVRCSPHTLRHTFAISFLRAGGGDLSLQAMLGHESLVMTQNYVRFVQADLRQAMRQHSPVQFLTKNRK